MMSKYPRLLFQMKERKSIEVLSKVVELVANNVADGIYAFNKDEVRIFMFDDDGLLIFDSDE